MVNIFTIAQMNPEELVQYLIGAYAKEIPSAMETQEDLSNANIMLGQIANEKTFLYSLLAYLKTRARTERGKGKENKNTAEEMAMRRDAVELVLEAVKNQYDAVSRMLTVKQMKNDELKMSGDRYFERSKKWN